MQRISTMRFAASNKTTSPQLWGQLLDCITGPRFPSVLLSAIVVIPWICSLGCDQTKVGELGSAGSDPTEASTTFVQGKLSPAATIRECIEAYQRLDSYEDKASVELRYRLDGEVQADTAPLSIAWQKNGPVGMKVYSVQAGPDEQSDRTRWRLRVNRADFPAPNQVISRSVPAHVDFAWLLDDPLVAQHIAAGLAGFPPQLDMLLSPQPMRQLVNDEAVLKFGPQTTIDGRSCSVVNVTQGQLTFRLFIDKATMLLRRIRLPSGNLPPEILAQESVSDIELWIDLKDVRANSAIAWDSYAVRPKVNELLVNHFVPNPPQLEVEGVGQKVPGFHLEDADGQTVYNTRKRTTSNKATVLMWLADHPACRVAAQQISLAAEAIRSNPDYEMAVDFVPVWAEPEPPSGETFESLQSSWSLPARVALDRAALGRDVFNVQEAPSLVVLDRYNKVQIRETRANPLLGQVLPDLLTRICDGQDLAADLIRQDQHAQRRFVTELKRAMTIESPALPQPMQLRSSYDPELFSLGEPSVDRVESDVVAMTVDINNHVWTLRADGNLHCSEVTGQGVRQLKEYSTAWSPVDEVLSDRAIGDLAQGDWAATARLLVDEQKRFVAYTRQGASRIALCDLKTEQSSLLRMQQDAHVQDLAWMPLNNQPSRLAVITSAQTVVLVDPRDQEQLSGKCPARPLAVLPHLAAASEVDGRVVLADRSVQILELAADSTAHSVPGLGRPAAFTMRRGGEAASRTLDFRPALGPWNCGPTTQTAESNSAATTRPILAAGWLAQDEPAVFMLDENLRPLWHYRAAIQTDMAQLAMTASAVDPRSGQPVWIKVDQDQTLHLLRRDGLTDHFRLADEICGVGLVPSGDMLLFCAAHTDRIAVYPIRWK